MSDKAWIAASVVVSIGRKRPGREAGFGLAGLSDLSGHWCMEWKGVLHPRGMGQGDLWLGGPDWAGTVVKEAG